MKKIRMTRKKILVIAIIFSLVAVAVLIIHKNPKEEKSSETKRQYFSQLTGLEVSKEDSERPILGIMVENSEEARPQTGLDSAGVVFEAVTEGGITRYLALYQEDHPEIVGPARSIRTHFLDWLMGFDASIAHVGGSAEALELADTRNTRSLNQFKYDEPYYRDQSREAPHNMYVRTEGLRELQDELKHKKSNMSTIPRSDNVASPTPDATNITIEYSAPIFGVEFRYDPSTNTYVRFLGGEPHIDKATGKPISVKNLIVLKTAVSGSSVQALGNGEALVYKNGTVTKGSWIKQRYEDRIVLTDEQDLEIPLNRGDAWFAVTGNDKSVIHSAQQNN